jgi:hypothetical protein
MEVPIGTILPWYGSNVIPPPPKYRHCNGDIITKSQYEVLFALLASSGNPTLKEDINNPGHRLPVNEIRLPELSGCFLRGYDSKKLTDTDPDRNYVGHIQRDSIKKHRHTVTNHTFVREVSGGNIKVGADTAALASDNPLTNLGNYETGAGLDNETRPVNVNVAFIIRVLD